MFGPSRIVMFSYSSQPSLIHRGSVYSDCPNVSEYLKRNQHLRCSFIPFRLISTDGGENSEDHVCENMLKQDNSVYCTNKSENTNIILKFDNQKISPTHVNGAVITHLIVKAPEGSPCPIGSGFIFISQDEPIVEDTNFFNSFTHSKYLEYKKSKKMAETDPAAYFELKDSDYYTVIKLDVPRYGKYVLVKLLKSRNNGDNMVIQYIGFKGYVGKHSFASGALL